MKYCYLGYVNKRAKTYEKFILMTVGRALKYIDESLLVSKVFANRKMAAMLALGFSAGLPILLVYTVLSAWLRESGASRSTIGFFVVVGFAYSLKFIWAPLVDRMKIPGFSKLLGNRRAWILFSTLGTTLAILSMSFQDPSKDLVSVAFCAVLIAFSSATLDVCVDAWRVDISKNEEQAAMSAVYQLGYRFGMVSAISGGLFLADIGGYQLTYIGLAFLALLGSSTPLWAAEPHKKNKSTNENKTEAFNCLIKGSLTLLIISALLYLGIKDGGYLRYIGSSLYNIYEGIYSYLPAGVGKSIAFFVLMIFSLLPFLGTVFFLTLGRSYLKKDEIYNVPIIGDLADLVKRTGWMALLVFAIVVSYRISDTTMGVMAMPLYIDLGYSKAVIGGVKGIFGISMLIFGAFAGSWSVAKIGMSKTMIFGAFVTIFTNLNFAWLATVSTPNTIYLFSTIGADNLAAGFSGSVFIAFMSILVNKKYSASQYALFSSLFALYGKSLAAFSGVLADKVDYVWFFVLTSVLGVPALIFVLYAWLNGFTDSINEDAVAKSCL